MTWQADDEKYIWHPFTQVKTESKPLVIMHAIDATLISADGSTYLDCNSSWWVNVHGHQVPEIDAAIVAQLQRLDHATFLGSTHKPGIELAELLIDRAPTGLTRAFFGSDGASSVEAAIKMAFQ